MPVNSTPAAHWGTALKVISVSALAAMAIGAIVLPVLGVIAATAFGD
jgi:hypothetical protein